MTATVSDYLKRLLRKYEKITGKSKFEIVIELDISFARYYAYRSGRGNPTGKTLHKIHTAIYARHPEIVIETILESMDETYLRIIIEKMAEYLTEEHFEILVEKVRNYEKQYILAVSGHTGNNGRPGIGPV